MKVTGDVFDSGAESLSGRFAAGTQPEEGLKSD